MLSSRRMIPIRRIDFINLAGRSIVVVTRDMEVSPWQCRRTRRRPKQSARLPPRRSSWTGRTRRRRSPGRYRPSPTGAGGAPTTCSARSTSSATSCAGRRRDWCGGARASRCPSGSTWTARRRGWRRRTNPVHTMLDTGTDAAAGLQGFPHGIGGADDVIAMPLQCSTQWDGLGHIFDHGKAWNGRDAARTVTSDGDLVTGIEKLARPVCGRGVLLDAGRVIGPSLGTADGARGELPDGFAITQEHLTATAAGHGVTVGRGDLLLVRTGRYARALREGWGDYAGGASPGLSFTTAGWLHRTEIAAVATDTWGFEVRPNEFDVASFQPLHQVAIPNMGLLIGEMWALEELAEDCAADGVYEFFLTAAPLPITGAVGVSRQPDRRQVTAGGTPMPAVSNVLVAGAGLAGTAAAAGLAAAGVAVDLIDVKPEVSRHRLGHHDAGQRAARAAPPRRLGRGARRRATRSTASGCAPPTRPGPCSPRYPTHGPAAPTCRPRSACPGPRSRASWRTARPRRAPSSGSAPASARCRRTAAGWTSCSPTARPDDTTWSSARTASGPRPGAMIGISDEPRPTGMGIFRGVRAPAGQRHPDRPVLRRPGLHRRILPDRRELALRVPRGGRAGPVRADPGRAAGRHAGAGRGLPRPLGRDPRDARPTPERSATPSSRRWSWPRRGTGDGSC